MGAVGYDLGGFENEHEHEDTLMTTFRLTAEHADTGEVQTLATSRKLENLSKRSDKDGEMWDRLGWEGLMLEDNSLGSFTETSREHLTGMLKRREISYAVFQDLKSFTD